MQVLDFTKSGFGMVVVRSEHYKKEHFVKKGAKRQLGIIVGKNFYQDTDDKGNEDKGQVVCWPIIHWEGAVMESTCHPANVTPYRKHNLPSFEMIDA